MYRQNADNQQPSTSKGIVQNVNSCKTPSVEIVIQPEKKGVKFRYPVEGDGRSACIKGCQAKNKHKLEGFATYPTIKINNFSGPALIIVSLVTKDDFKQHPHKLVGKSEDFVTFTRGVCKRVVDVVDSAIIIFNNLRIQCIRRIYFEESINLRQEVLEDFPYCYGFYNLEDDLDSYRVRLCFQVFLNWRYDVYELQLPPAISDIIWDKRVPDLIIRHISRHFCYVTGGAEMVLLCEKVPVNDITVIFFNDDNKWKVEINEIEVFKQIALMFKIPQYGFLDIVQPVQVFIKLYSRSRDEYSDPFPFQYLPIKELNLQGNNLPSKKQKLDLNRLKVPLENRTFCEILNDTVSFLQNVGPQNLEALIQPRCSVGPETSTTSRCPINSRHVGNASDSGGSGRNAKKASKKPTTKRGPRKISSRSRESHSRTSQTSTASATVDGSISNSSVSYQYENVLNSDDSAISSTVYNVTSNLDPESFRGGPYSHLKLRSSTTVERNLTNSSSSHNLQTILDLDESAIHNITSNDSFLLHRESFGRHPYTHLESQPSIAEDNVLASSFRQNFRNALDLDHSTPSHTVSTAAPNLNPELFRRHPYTDLESQLTLVEENVLTSSFSQNFRNVLNHSTLSNTVSNAAPNLNPELFSRHPFAELRSQTNTNVDESLSNFSSNQDFRNTDFDNSTMSYTVLHKAPSLTPEMDRRQPVPHLESQPHTNFDESNSSHLFRSIVDSNLESESNASFELQSFLQPQPFVNTAPKLERNISIDLLSSIDFESQKYLEEQSNTTRNIIRSESSENLEYQPVIDLLLETPNDLNRVYRPNMDQESSMQSNNLNWQNFDSQSVLLPILNWTPNNFNQDALSSSSEFSSTPASVNVDADYGLGDAEDVRLDTDELNRALEKVSVTYTNNLKNLSGDLF